MLQFTGSDIADLIDRANANDRREFYADDAELYADFPPPSGIPPTQEQRETAFLQKQWDKSKGLYWHYKDMQEANHDRFLDAMQDDLRPDAVKSAKPKRSLSKWGGGVPSGFFLWKKTECQDAYIIYGDRTSPDPEHKAQAIVVGCGKCETCQHEKLEAKRRLWHARLATMLPYWCNNKGSAHFSTLTISDEDFTDDQSELRKRFSRLMNRVRQVYKSDDVRYWMIIERGTQSTQRLHIHCIFFLTHDVKWTELWGDGMGFRNRDSRYDGLIRSYWRKHFKAPIWHSCPVECGPGLASYLVKYVGKALGSERIMTSKFGWKAFMEERQAEAFESAGIPDGTDRFYVVSTLEFQNAKEGKPFPDLDSLVNCLLERCTLGLLITQNKCYHPMSSDAGAIVACADDAQRPVNIIDFSSSDIALIPYEFRLNHNSDYHSKLLTRLAFRLPQIEPVGHEDGVYLFP